MPELDPNRWRALAVICAAFFMTILDVSIVNVALPSIGRSLHFSQANLQWVITAYAITFGGFLLLGGRAADLFGRRRTFLVGVGVFTAASFVCGLSSSEAVLIAARAVQGLGAAIISPAALSIVMTTFEEGAERNKALGIWGAMGGSGAAAGVLFGGILTKYLGWEWIFFVNVPVGILALALSFVLIAETRAGTGEQRLDLTGLLTSSAGLLALVYGLIEANKYGWSSGTILTLFAAAALLLAGFVVLERHKRHAMLDLRLFAKRTFAGANIAALLVSLAMFGIFFFVSIYMQNILGYSPVHTGVIFLPMTVLVVVSAPLAGKATDLIGPRWPITVGMLLLTASLLSFSRLGVHASFSDLLPGMMIGGVGIGIAMGPMTAAALSTASIDEAGVVAGVITTSRQVGGALGVALMGAIVAAAETVSPGDPRFPLQFVHGFQHALETGAAITLVGAIAAALLVHDTPQAAARRSRAVQRELAAVSGPPR